MASKAARRRSSKDRAKGPAAVMVFRSEAEVSDRGSTERRQERLIVPLVEGAGSRVRTIDRVSTTDPQGRGVSQLIARDCGPVDQLFLKGKIDQRQHDAACRFREAFHKAGLHGSGAGLHEVTVDTSRRVDYTPLGLDHARDVTGVMGVLGIQTGSIIWHVVGYEETVKEWVTRMRNSQIPMNEHRAAGLLDGALMALAVHYGL